MNKHQQSGMTTLLITSMLLIVALLFSLASYKNLFYQIKRTQNEVLARQAHWAAEGGLECGFAEISNKSDVNTSLDKCKEVIDGQLLTLNIDTDDGKSVLTSKTTYKIITKTIVAGGARSSGVIKSSNDLYFYGDHEYYSDPGVKLNDGTWECVLLRYKKIFYMHDDTETFMTNKGAKENVCNDKYNTDTSSKLLKFDDDVRLEPSMDIFKETFNVNREEWIDIRDGDVFNKIDIKNIDSCGSEIASLVNEDKRHIWATGSCVLTGQGLVDLQKKSYNVGGIFLVIENGVLGFNGSAVDFPIIIYHFITDFNATSNSWGTLWPHINNTTIFSPSSDKDLTEKDKQKMLNDLVFYMYGTFILSGGYIFDTPDKLTYLNAGSSLSYDGKLINDLLAPFGKPTWQQGSWHDF
ncbi:hypothetical protein GLP21_11360 [Photobacterium carnosum]|uniref:hypothetical protein n=1 Tax=Photobacterium carnosum TaxID=2023717 RepID=UPI001E381F90|nr:hypothetical protein [Photobacterium carnosum]MCD9549225.1 hypothetical protein [Photobacterium carnosum]MCF2306164.1 hypothetical protein [Photobacterium carnosum]